MEDAPTIRIAKWPDPWARLPEVAERLGVEPFDGVDPPGTCRMLLVLQDGRRYDFFDLAVALLDRMDEVLKRTS